MRIPSSPFRLGRFASPQKHAIMLLQDKDKGPWRTQDYASIYYIPVNFRASFITILIEVSEAILKPHQCFPPEARNPPHQISLPRHHLLLCHKIGRIDQDGVDKCPCGPNDKLSGLTTRFHTTDALDAFINVKARQTELTRFRGGVMVPEILVGCCNGSK